MQEPRGQETPAADVDEYVERMRQRYEEASARVLGAEREDETTVHIDDRVEETLEVAGTDGIAVRHRSHRSEQAATSVPLEHPVADSPAFEVAVAEPETVVDDAPLPRPVDVTVPVRRPVRRTQAPQTQVRRYIVPFLGVVFLGLVAIWLAAWIEFGAADGVSIQERIDQALALPEFSDVAVRLDGGTIVLEGAVGSDDLVVAATRVFGRIPGVGGVDNRLTVSAGAVVSRSDDDILAEVAAALDANGFGDLAVAVTAQMVTLDGTVRSSDARAHALQVARDVDGVTSVDDSIEVVPLRPPSELLADARAALVAGGWGYLEVDVEGDTAIVRGVVERAHAEDGLFPALEPLRRRLLEIDGIGAVSLRVQLTGDESLLREALRSIAGSSPIVFAPGSAVVPPEGRTTLRRIADSILGEPGLRILIAGYPDATGDAGINAVLARQRGAAVRNELVAAGVPADLLVVVAYDDLFPAGTAGANTRVEFEVEL